MAPNYGQIILTPLHEHQPLGVHSENGCSRPAVGVPTFAPTSPWINARCPGHGLTDEPFIENCRTGRIVPVNDVMTLKRRSDRSLHPGGRTTFAKFLACCCQRTS